MEEDLVMRVKDFMPGRSVAMCVGGGGQAPIEVRSGLPHGSQASPLLFTAHFSRVHREVEKCWEEVGSISFVDDVT